VASAPHSGKRALQALRARAKRLCRQPLRLSVSLIDQRLSEGAYMMGALPYARSDMAVQLGALCCSSLALTHGKPASNLKRLLDEINARPAAALRRGGMFASQPLKKRWNIDAEGDDVCRASASLRNAIRMGPAICAGPFWLGQCCHRCSGQNFAAKEPPFIYAVCANLPFAEMAQRRSILTQFKVLLDFLSGVVQFDFNVTSDNRPSFSPLFRRYFSKSIISNLTRLTIAALFLVWCNVPTRLIRRRRNLRSN
jgi:hypothetical protein